MSKNHLIEQIKEYDQTIKFTDNTLSQKDNQLLLSIANTNAVDEHLTEEELSKLFSQQIRKIMSKEVKKMEKTIKGHVAAG